MRQELARRRRATNAFTLIELLVVIVILAILAAVVIQKVTGRVDDAREAKAVTDMKSLSDTLEMYRVDMGHYPTTEQGLNALVQNVEQSEKWKKPYINSVPMDPWGKPYKYTSPGESGREFDISTLTPEGKALVSPN